MKNTLLSKIKIPIRIFFIVLLFAACNNKTEPNGDTKADITEKAKVEAADASTNFDVVILNGRVMDPETNLDSIQNVGILNGKIAIITDKEIKGKETIDAKGHVVSPGFIDTHVHVVDSPFGQKLMLRDGVTTPLELEVGAYPLDVFYNKLEGKSQTNFGATISTIGVREKVFNPKYTSKTGMFVTDIEAHDENAFLDMQWSGRTPTLDEIDKINQMIDEGLTKGALGIGVPVGYMIKGVTSKETASWQKLAGKYNRATFLHGRFSSQHAPTTGILGFEELMANQAIYGGGLLLCHMHQQALAETKQALEMVDDAR
ncbi:MAG: hypothetical protein WBM43_07710, partial [Flavobacteriaceae bacterium]